jgi:hypothetical protein
MARTGRPRTRQYDPTVAEQICALIAEGKSIVECAQVKGIPSRKYIYLWLNESAEFRDMYARAREQRADAMAHEVVFIADTEEDPQRARNRMDARKWAASKMNPKVYGDRTTIAGTGDKEDAIHVEGSGLVETLIGRLAGIASRE